MFYRVDESKEQSGRGNSSAEGSSFQGERGNFTEYANTASLRKTKQLP